MNNHTAQEIIDIKNEAQDKFGGFASFLNGIRELANNLSPEELKEFIQRLPEVRASIIWADYLRYRNEKGAPPDRNFTDYARYVLSGEEPFQLIVPPAKNAGTGRR